MDQETVKQLNQSLAQHFSRDRSIDYDTVACLVFVWREADHPGYKTEAEAFKNFFETRLNYPTNISEIPTTGCHFHVMQALSNFLSQFCTKRNLAIICYGGHGDPDREKDEDGHRPRRSVWARTARPTPSDEVVKWSDIQSNLEEFHGHVFLLLDSCYAAQTGRATSSKIPKNVEVQAACAMRVETPEPGPYSFSTKWMSVAGAILDEKGFIVIADLHNTLTNAENQLAETPFYFPLGEEKRSIRLDLFKRNQPSIGKLNPSLAFSIATSEPITDNLLKDILYWLQEFAPRKVAYIEASQLALGLEKFITPFSESVESNITIGTLDVVSQADIRAAWQSFLSGTAQSFLPLHAEGSSGHICGSSTDEIRVERFLEDFHHNVQAVQRLVERGILSSPLDSAGLSGSNLEELGVADTLRIRFLRESFQSDDLPLPHAHRLFPESEGFQTPCPLMERRHKEHGDILVEYKRYDSGLKDPLVIRCEKQIGRLSAVLEAAQPAKFRTPKCLGYLREPGQSRFAFLFQKPYLNGGTPITLRHILDQEDAPRSKHAKIRDPSLGERFAIARKLGEALAKWHTAGWVHQGIASHNIVFFPSLKGVDYNEPYLCGFEHSRMHSDHSWDRHLYHPDFQVYLHPERQGDVADVRHTKTHDIYAFGLLLVELALWDSIPANFQGDINKRGLAAVKDCVIKRMREKVGHRMGSAYETAVMVCLEGRFKADTEGEDRKLELTTEFEQEVLARLYADPTKHNR